MSDVVNAELLRENIAHALSGLDADTWAYALGEYRRMLGEPFPRPQVADRSSVADAFRQADKVVAILPGLQAEAPEDAEVLREVMLALEDLSFECFSPIAPCNPPSVATYSRTFDVLDRHRKARGWATVPKTAISKPRTSQAEAQAPTTAVFKNVKFGEVEYETTAASVQPPFNAYRECIRCFGFGTEVFMGDEVTCGHCMGKKRTPKSFDELVAVINSLTSTVGAPAPAPTRETMGSIMGLGQQPASAEFVSFPENSSHGDAVVERVASIIYRGTCYDAGCTPKSSMEIANEVTRYIRAAKGDTP